MDTPTGREVACVLRYEKPAAIGASCHEDITYLLADCRYSVSRLENRQVRSIATDCACVAAGDYLGEYLAASAEEDIKPQRHLRPGSTKAGPCQHVFHLAQDGGAGERVICHSGEKHDSSGGVRAVRGR
jgi:hypothetical protein